MTFCENDGSSTPTLFSTLETSVDGLTNWNTIYNGGAGVLSRTETKYPGGGYRLVTQVAPDNSSSVTAYLAGRALGTTNYDGNGGVLGSMVNTYDAHNRLATVTDARNGTTTYTYDDADRRVGVTSPVPTSGGSAQTVTNGFDGMGRVLLTRLGDGAVVTNDYFGTGELRITAGARTYPAAYNYDEQGRMTNLTTWTNFAGNSGVRNTAWGYVPKSGFLTNKLYADTTGPSYTTTAGGRMSTLTLARGTNCAYTYTAAGEVATIVHNDGTPGVTNTYDRRGRLVTISHGPTVTTRTYNDAGEMTGEYYTGGPLDGLVVTNVFDSVLRRSAVGLLNGTTPLLSRSYGYDAASRLASVGDGTNSGNYSYLANSALVGQIDFTNASSLRMTLSKQYDLLNRLTNIVSSTNAVAVAGFAYQYNDANQRTRLDITGAGYTSATHWNFGYDSLGQVNSAKRYWADNTPVAGEQFEFGFDDIGNRTVSWVGGDASGGSLRVASYTNNAVNQITSRAVPGAVDVIGEANASGTVTVNNQRGYRSGTFFRNEVALDNSSAAVYATLTNLAVLQNGTNADIVATNIGHVYLAKTPENYLYDLDGNLTNDGRWVLSWDADNRPTNIVSFSGAPTASKYQLGLTYDYMARRVQKIVSTNNGSGYVGSYTNNFIYDGWNLIAILNENNVPMVSFTWGTDLSGSEQGAGGVGGLISMTVHSGALAGTYFYGFDGNGNVVLLTRASDGAIMAQYEYGAFGELVRATGLLAFVNPFRFSTKFQDDETGFCYYGYRYYDSNIGRWLNRDSMLEEEGGFNLFSFNENSSVNLFDKDGQAPSSIDGVSYDQYGNQGRPVAPPPLPNSGGYGPLHAGHHTMKMTFGCCCNCSKLSDDIYKEMKQFKDFRPNGIASVTVGTTIFGNKVYQTAGFLMSGIKGFLSSSFAGNDALVQVALNFNEPNREITGTTLGDHMLVGTRHWNVVPDKSNGQCVITINTWAQERTQNRRNHWGAKVVGRSDQIKIWTDYFNNIGNSWAKNQCFIKRTGVADWSNDL